MFAIAIVVIVSTDSVVLVIVIVIVIVVVCLARVVAGVIDVIGRIMALFFIGFVCTGLLLLLFLLIV